MLSTTRVLAGPWSKAPTDAATPTLIGVVVNPRSRHNRRNPGRAVQLQRLFGDQAIVRETSSVDELDEVVAELFEKRAGLWIADGGDGALHWLLRVARRYLAHPEQRALGRRLPPMLPAGTGTINVVANAVGLPLGDDFYRVLRQAVLGRRVLPLRKLDVMDIELTRSDERGQRKERTHGFVAAAGGVGQRFFGELEREGGERGPATVARLLGRSAASWLLNRTPFAPLLSEQLRTFEERVFRPTSARVTVDGKTFAAKTLTGINIASVPVRFGAVMSIFGKAREPGVLHALYGNPSAGALIGSLPRGVFGLPPKGEGIVDTTCRTMTVEATGSELLAPVIDGDTYDHVQRVTFSLGQPLEVPLLA